LHFGSAGLDYLRTWP